MRIKNHPVWSRIHRPDHLQFFGDWGKIGSRSLSLYVKNCLLFGGCILKASKSYYYYGDNVTDDKSTTIKYLFYLSVIYGKYINIMG